MVIQKSFHFEVLSNVSELFDLIPFHTYETFNILLKLLSLKLEIIGPLPPPYDMLLHKLVENVDNSSPAQLY